ncbi:MAG: nucleotidyltransferase family protein [Desulfitobacterium sp.]|uniref:nucleotidyltransferase family protein n=1 Tax=Desulfitobacterium sp. THU1 TaxID=3138072 RepID=UPI00311E280E
MAAGKASRMGQDKLSLPWGDTTILGHVLRTLKLAIREHSRGANHQEVHCEILVIAPKACSAYRLGEEGNFLIHDDFIASNCQWIQSELGQPLSQTIRSGLKDYSLDGPGICFIPGDQVGMDEQTLARMIQIFIEEVPDFLVPKALEVIGSPVFFHSRYISELMNLQGEQGGKQVLNRYRERWVSFPVPDGFFLDIDTMTEYLSHRPKLG